MELEILENTKMLLGIKDDTANSLLLFLIKDTINAVMSYCRIVIVPNQLYGLIAQIVAEVYRSRGYENPETSRQVKSITEGERRVEFESTVSYFNSYLPRLEPFVNRSARLPSEMKNNCPGTEDSNSEAESGASGDDISEVESGASGDSISEAESSDSEMESDNSEAESGASGTESNSSDTENYISETEVQL